MQSLTFTTKFSSRLTMVFMIIALILAILLAGNRSVVHADEFTIADGDVAGLIDALNTANANGVADTINLAVDGDYTILAFSRTPGDLPSIESEIVINGNGASIGSNVFDPDDPSSTFGIRILHTTSTGNLILNNTTIGGGHSANGSGLKNDGVSILTNCTFGGNGQGDEEQISREGGAINNHGQLTLISCTVNDNISSRAGGGIFNVGKLILITLVNHQLCW